MSSKSYILSKQERNVLVKFRSQFSNGAKCTYCQKELTFREIKIDHKIPVSRGGETTFENLTVACQWCNSEKGMKTVEEYDLYLTFKNAMNKYSTQTLVDSLDYYQDILRTTRNNGELDTDGFPICWKCQAISKLLNKRVKNEHR